MMRRKDHADETPAERAREERLPRPEEAPPTGEAAPAEAAPAEAAEETAEKATAADLEEARRECQELMDRLLRTAADYQNFQKRVSRRLDEAREFAVRDLVADLAPVIDNFERALRAAEGEANLDAFRQGIALVRDQFLAALQKHGVEPIEALGKPFDPSDHEAAGHAPSAAQPAGRVVEVLQAGYRLNGRTIRPSRVIVSSGPLAGQAGPPGAGGPGGPGPDTG